MICEHCGSKINCVDVKNKQQNIMECECGSAYLEMGEFDNDVVTCPICHHQLNYKVVEIKRVILKVGEQFEV